VLKEALSGAGERCYSTLGFAAIMLSGPLYLIWNSFEFAAVFGKIHAGAVPAAIVSLGDMGDLLLFMAGFLTYLATVAFAASLGRVQWLGRRATRAFIIVNGVALLFLVIRGLQFPDPRALSLRPGTSISVLLSESQLSHSSCLSCWASSCSGAPAKSNLDEIGLNRATQMMPLARPGTTSRKFSYCRKALRTTI
jgi:hypothetical protein